MNFIDISGCLQLFLIAFIDLHPTKVKGSLFLNKLVHSFYSIVEHLFEVILMYNTGCCMTKYEYDNLFLSKKWKKKKNNLQLTSHQLNGYTIVNIR